MAKPAPRPLALPPGCGIVVPAADFERRRAELTPWGLGERIASNNAWPPQGARAFESSLLLAVDGLDYSLLPAAFGILERWHAAAPLYSYDALAVDHGTTAERAYTASIVGDLRVPLFETGALFVRWNEETEALLDKWREERDGWPDGAESRLAFHRAYYRIRPLLLPLPTTWVAGRPY